MNETNVIMGPIYSLGDLGTKKDLNRFHLNPNPFFICIQEAFGNPNEASKTALPWLVLELFFLFNY